MTFVSLFAGAGGFDLGLEREGHECVGQCEIEPVARAVLERHWPHVPKHDDVTTITASTFEHPDLVTFGSPCQDLSVAGKRAGMSEGTRSGLFHEAVRYIREIQEATGGRSPKFAVWENVPGAYSSNDGRDFAAVLSLLVGGDVRRPAGGWGVWGDYSGVAFGPKGSAEWRTLDSRYFGVAQRRRRVFLVYRPGGECAGSVLLEPDGVQRDTQESEAAREGLAVFSPGGFGGYREGVGTLRANGGDVGPGSENLALAETLTVGANQTYGFPGDIAAVPRVMPTMRAGSVGTASKNQISGDTRDEYIVPVAQALTTGTGRRYDPETETLVAFSCKDSGLDETTISEALTTSADRTRAAPVIAFDRSQITSKHNRTRVEPGQPNGTLAAGGNPHVAYYESGPGWFSEGVGTLRAEGENRPSRPAHVIHAPSTYAVRRLTPRECERLQGFPDDHTRYHPDGREIADTHRYRLMGNAVTVNVIQWIGRRLS